MPQRLSDATLRERVLEIRSRLEAGLADVDPHRRITGRPVRYQVIDGRTFEIVYRDVARVDEAEIAGMRRLIGAECYWSVSPQGPETVQLRLVIPLNERG